MITDSDSCVQALRRPSDEKQNPYVKDRRAVMRQRKINVFFVARVECSHHHVEAGTPVPCDEEMPVACGADGV